MKKNNAQKDELPVEAKKDAPPVGCIVCGVATAPNTKEGRQELRRFLKETYT